jgi:hypothetical protein
MIIRGRTLQQILEDEPSDIVTNTGTIRPNGTPASEVHDSTPIKAPSLSPHAMSVKEAIRIADRWSGGWQETPGGLQEVLSVLVDHIVTTESRLKGIQKALLDSQDRIQALSLDLAIREHRT